MSILVLQSSWWGRESWLLCLICLPGVSWWLGGSSSRCHGVVCDLWLWYFLIILTIFASVNITFEGWLILVLTEKMHHLFCYMALYVPLFQVIYEVFSYLWIYSSQLFLVHWKQDSVNDCSSSFWNSYEMCKRIAFFKVSVLIKWTNSSFKTLIWPVIYMISLSLKSFNPISILAVRQQSKTWSLPVLF